MPYCGLLNVNKPSGLTSRQVVDRIARLVRPAKAGHAGTLDPLATGVLVVAVGSATRLMQYLHRESKSYAATFLLGRQSATEDIEGEITELPNAPVPSLKSIQQACQQMLGIIQQRPPAYSAIKVQGRRAYQLARQGRPPDLPPRPVTIHQLDVVDYCYPELKLVVHCSSGTYIRSLGRDLAESLGTAAIMSHLVRTSVGDFLLQEAAELDQLSATNWTEHLCPALRAVRTLQRIEVSPAELARLRLGQTIGRARLPHEGNDDWAVVDVEGRLAAILRRRSDESLGPVVNLCSVEDH